MPKPNNATAIFIPTKDLKMFTYIFTETAGRYLNTK